MGDLRKKISRWARLSMAEINETKTPTTQSHKLWVKIGVFFSIAAIIGIIVALVINHDFKRTSDAYVEGNQMPITPLKEGFITSICKDDTYLVKKGELLITLDRTDAQIALDEAKASLANMVRNVCQIYHQVFAYEYELQSKKAELIKAEEFYSHRSAVLASGAISLEDFQTSVANLDSTLNIYQQVLSLYQKEAALIQGRSIRNNPLVLEAADRVVKAWVELYRCNIYAPTEGLVAQRSAQVGKWVKAGEPLLYIIPLDQIWINANFKETQMKRMKIGQKVNLHADMYGKNVDYRGVIVGLPGGAGNAFSILPPQNLSGNWIKIVQRLPVRVAIHQKDLLKYPLRIGMTMHATVDVRDQSDSYFQSLEAKSPTYQTDIYKLEIKGSQCLVNTIFKQNFDPSLMEYEKTPYYPLSIEE